MLETMLRDVRIAARGLWRNPGFTTLAVVTLALGIGATTAVFSVVYGVLFRPLPFPNADRLVQVIQLVEPPAASPNREPSRGGVTHGQFVDLLEHTTTLASVGRYNSVSATLVGRDDAVRLMGATISPSFFAGLGVAPLIGRTFVAEDAVPGADPVVVLSHQTWRTYFGEAPSVLESRITLGDASPRVIGVMPRGFGFPSLASPLMSRNSAGEFQDAPEFWTPIPPPIRPAQSTGGFSLFPAFAMLREGVPIERAEVEVRNIASPLPNGRRSVLMLASARDEIGRRFSRALLIFQAGVALVLLIACVNVVNLLLARAAYRQSELAVRAALGASRARLVRDGVAEALLLALSGGMLGCLFAYGLIAAVRTLPPNVLPRLGEIRIDLISLAFALAVALAAGLSVGLFSAIRIARTTPWAGSRPTVPVVTRRTRPSNVLVVAELATAMVLVTAAGLLTSSFVNLMTHETGYNPEGVVTFRVNLPGSRYPTPAAQVQLYEELAARLRTLPGVMSVGGKNGYLTSSNIGFWDMVVDGRSAGEATFAFGSVVPGYFETLEIPLRRGRSLRDSDLTSSAPVMVVSETFARRYLGDDPIGRRVAFAKRPPAEVVGVVADTMHTPDDTSPRAAIYFPPDAITDSLAQLILLVRTASGPGTLIPAARAAVRSLDPQLAVYDVTTVEEVLQQSSSSSRLYTLVGVFCGAVAFALAAIGLYGLLAYLVGMRTREFGIRMALGANRRALVRSVTGQALRLTVVGTMLGLAGSIAVTRSLQTLLFDVTPGDPATLGVAVMLFMAAAAAASYVPSRRATRVDPVIALRSE